MISFSIKPTKNVPAPKTTNEPPPANKASFEKSNEDAKPSPSTVFKHLDGSDSEDDEPLKTLFKDSDDVPRQIDTLMVTGLDGDRSDALDTGSSEHSPEDRKRFRRRNSSEERILNTEKVGLIYRGNQQLSGKPARYLTNINRAIKKRELELEVVREKQLSKVAAEEVGSTEVFITKAYAKRLEERKAAEERLRKESEEDERRRVVAAEADLKRNLLSKGMITRSKMGIENEGDYDY